MRMNGHTVDHANISYVVRDYVSPCVEPIRDIVRLEAEWLRCSNLKSLIT